MKFIHGLMFISSLGGTVTAATLTQTKTFAFTPTGNQILTFNEFDSMGGTRSLLSVTITTSLTKTGGSLYVDNDSAVAATGAISQSVTINLTATGASLINDLFDATIGSNVTATSFYSAELAPDDGDGAGYQAGGLDWAGTDFLDTTVSQTETAGAPSTYVGTGTTFTIKVSGAQSTDTSSISGIAGAFAPAEAQGFVTVTYNYVPEPASAMFGSLGFLAILRRRR